MSQKSTLYLVKNSIFNVYWEISDDLHGVLVCYRFFASDFFFFFFGESEISILVRFLVTTPLRSCSRKAKSPIRENYLQSKKIGKRGVG